MFDHGVSLNLRGLKHLVIIDYIALWRLKRLELIARIALAVFACLYAIAAEINNSWEYAGGKHYFMMWAALLAFMLINRCMISNRDFRKQAPWIRDILPFNRLDLCLAEYFSFFLAFLPLILILTCSVVWLFNMPVAGVFIFIGQMVLYLAMLSLNAVFLLYSRISERGGLLLQFSIGIISIVIYGYSTMIFIILSLLYCIVLLVSFRDPNAQKNSPL